MAKNYPGNLLRRGTGYRWRVCVGGERHAETFHTSNRTEAAKRARERYRELEARHERRSEGLATDAPGSLLKKSPAGKSASQVRQIKEPNRWHIHEIRRATPLSPPG